MTLDELTIDQEKYAHSPWNMKEFLMLLAKNKTAEVLAEKGDEASEVKVKNELENQVKKYHSLLQDALIQREIPIMNSQGANDPKGKYVFYLDETTVLPMNCLNWAKKCSFSIPGKFYKYINKLHPLPKEDISKGIESSDSLDGKERRELGALRREKEKWDLSVEAAVMAGIYCAREGARKPATRAELKDYLHREGIKNLPETTFNKVWGYLPSEYKHKGGRPEGTKDAH